ncbi:MAG: 2-phosphosulfolactate phosphatase [Flavobacteriales bacterium]
MSQKNNIKVCLTPSLFPIYSDRKSIVVVVDVLRATSAICTALELGVSSITPVSTVEEALEYKGNKDYLLAAERNGKIVSGFDMGNSPTEYLKTDFNRKKLVLTTTNGTKAINIAKLDHEVVIGSFLNIEVLASFLNSRRNDIIILCAGWRNDFCLEDTIFAGALAKKLITTNNFYSNYDSTETSIILYDKAKSDMFKFLEHSQHRNRLAHLNIESDVEYCLNQDITNIIPILKNDEIVPL